MYSSIRHYLGDSWERYQDAFKESLKAGMSLLDQINSYVAGHCGKQLRPMMVMLTTKLLGAPCDERIIQIAVASEMLHTATLIHDDVADDSQMRRGIPTAKAIYGNTASVLVGDYWLSKVIQNVVGHPDRRILETFARCLERLAEGEVLQIEKSITLDATQNDYFEIIYRKTAALFETAMLSAAYSSGATEEQCNAIGKYAFHYGRAFQIMDDIFDYSPQIETGKPFGQDILEKKFTLPLFGFFANAPEKEVSEFKVRVKEGDKNLATDAIDLVRKYGGIEYARKYLQKESLDAVDALVGFEKSEALDYLISLAASSRLS